MKRKTLVSGAALARHFSVSAMWITKLTADGVISRQADNRYDLDESRGRYLAHLRRRAAHREPLALEQLILTDADKAMLQRDFDQRRRQQPQATR